MSDSGKTGPEQASPEQAGSERVLVGEVSALSEGSQTEVQVGGVSVVVVCDGGHYYALRNKCSHQDFPLLGGDVSMGRITCSKHGAKFELSSGKAKTLPAVKPVAVYKTQIADGAVWIEIL